MSGWVAINEIGEDQTIAGDATTAQQNEDKLNGHLSVNLIAEEHQIQETLEAQEARIAKTYEGILRDQRRVLPQSNEWEAVKEGYKSVIGEIDCFFKPQWTELLQGWDINVLSVRIKYLCLKNLASMQQKDGDSRASMTSYLQALEIDDSDVMVWYDLGCTATEAEEYWVARKAFEEGLLIQANHIPTACKLAQVLYILQDDELCADLIDFVLSMDPSNPVCLQIKYQFLRDRILRTTDYFTKEELLMESRELWNRTRTFKRKLGIELLSTKRQKRIIEAPRDTMILKEPHDPTSNQTFDLQEAPTWEGLGLKLIEIFEKLTATEGSFNVPIRLNLTSESNQLSTSGSDKFSENSVENTDGMLKTLEHTRREGAKMIMETDEETTTSSVKGLINTSNSFTLNSQCSKDDEALLSDGVSSDNNQSPNKNRSKMKLAPESRRVSKRNQERQKAEHDAARKEALENDIAYRLKDIFKEMMAIQEHENSSDLDGLRRWKGKTLVEFWNWPSTADITSDLCICDNLGTKNHQEKETKFKMIDAAQDQHIRDFLHLHFLNNGIVHLIEMFMRNIGEKHWSLFLGPEMRSMVLLMERVVKNVRVNDSLKAPISFLGIDLELFLLELHLDELFDGGDSKLLNFHSTMYDMILQRLQLEMNDPISEGPNDEGADNLQRLQKIRFLWALGRYSVKNKHASIESQSIFNECLKEYKLWQQSLPVDSDGDIQLGNCRWDSCINEQAIQSKLDSVMSTRILERGYEAYQKAKRLQSLRDVSDMDQNQENEGPEALTSDEFIAAQKKAFKDVLDCFEKFYWPPNDVVKTKDLCMDLVDCWKQEEEIRLKRSSRIHSPSHTCFSTPTSILILAHDCVLVCHETELVFRLYASILKDILKEENSWYSENDEKILLLELVINHLIIILRQLHESKLLSHLRNHTGEIISILTSLFEVSKKVFVYESVTLFQNVSTCLVYMQKIALVKSNLSLETNGIPTKNLEYFGGLMYQFNLTSLLKKGGGASSKEKHRSQFQSEIIVDYLYRFTIELWNIVDEMIMSRRHRVDGETMPESMDLQQFLLSDEQFEASCMLLIDFVKQFEKNSLKKCFYGGCMVLLLLYLVHAYGLKKLHEPSEQSFALKLSLLKFMKFLHEKFGDMEICGDVISMQCELDAQIAKKSCRFTTICVDILHLDWMTAKAITSVGDNRLQDGLDAIELRDHILCSCYHCMYHLNISHSVDDHRSQAIEMDSIQAAKECFSFALPFIQSKIMNSFKDINGMMQLIRSNLKPYMKHKAEDSYRILDRFWCEPTLIIHQRSDTIKSMLNTLRTCKDNSISNPSEPFASSEMTIFKWMVKKNCFFYEALTYPVPKPRKKGRDVQYYSELEHSLRLQIDLYLLDLTYNPFHLDSWLNVAEIYEQLLHLVLDHSGLEKELCRSELPDDVIISWPFIQQVCFFTLCQESKHSSKPLKSIHAVTLKSDASASSSFIEEVNPSTTNTNDVVATESAMIESVSHEKEMTLLPDSFVNAEKPMMLTTASSVSLIDDLGWEHQAGIYVAIYRDLCLNAYQVAFEIAKNAEENATDDDFKEDEEAGECRVENEYLEIQLECSESRAMILFNQIQDTSKHASAYSLLCLECLSAFETTIDLCRRSESSVSCPEKATDEFSHGELLARSYYFVSKLRHKMGFPFPKVVEYLRLSSRSVTSLSSDVNMYPLYLLHCYRFKKILAAAIGEKWRMLLSDLEEITRSAWTGMDGSLLTHNDEAESEGEQSFKNQQYWACVQWNLRNCREFFEFSLAKNRFFHQSAHALSKWHASCPTLIHSNMKHTEDGDWISFERLQEAERHVSSDANEEARKTLQKYLFDKRRSQIVGLWLREVPRNDIEALNQRQRKFNRYREKYIKFYLDQIGKVKDVMTLKELTLWIAGCKEEISLVPRMFALSLLVSHEIMHGFLTDKADDHVKYSIDPNDQKKLDDEIMQQIDFAYSTFICCQENRHLLEENNLALISENLFLVTYVIFVLVERKKIQLGLEATPSHSNYVSNVDLSLEQDVFLEGLLSARNETKNSWFDLLIVHQRSVSRKLFFTQGKTFCHTIFPEYSGKCKLAKAKLRLNGLSPATDTASIDTLTSAELPPTEQAAASTALSNQETLMDIQDQGNEDKRKE